MTAQKMTREKVLGALARGYCTPVNEKKVLDADLLNACADEILGLQAQSERGAAQSALADAALEDRRDNAALPAVVSALELSRNWIAGRTAEFSDRRFTDRYGYADSGRKLLEYIDSALRGSK